MNLGDRLPDFMDEAGVTAETLADDILRNVAYINAMSTGLVDADDETARLLRDFFGKNAVELRDVDDLWSIRGRRAIDSVVETLGLGFDDRCALASEVAKSSRGTGQLEEEQVHDAYKRLIGKAPPLTQAQQGALSLDSTAQLEETTESPMQLMVEEKEVPVADEPTEPDDAEAAHGTDRERLIEALVFCCPHCGHSDMFAVTCKSCGKPLF
jgi:hypothetical protein